MAELSGLHDFDLMPVIAGPEIEPVAVIVAVLLSALSQSL